MCFHFLELCLSLVRDAKEGALDIPVLYSMRKT